MKSVRNLILSVASATILVGAVSSTGCTVHTNGMTLPSPDWPKQRVQYFPTGPQYPFTQEKATMDAALTDSQGMRE